MQRKIRRPVIEPRIIPGTGDVAGLTFAAIASCVIIFSQVTADAVARQAILEILTRMAILAVQTTVAFRECETGFQQVVETDTFPRGSRVTVMASRSVATTVHIVNGVTADTLGRCSIEGIAAMAVNAGDRSVFTSQSVADGIVIEAGL